MEQFKDLLNRIKNRNLKIDNPRSYRDLVKYVSDMKLNKSKKIKNELIYYLEQARLKMISYIQSFVLPVEEVDKIFTKVGIEARRQIMTIPEIIGLIVDKIIIQTSQKIYEGIKEGNFEKEVVESYEYAENLLLYILELGEQFRKKKV